MPQRGKDVCPGRRLRVDRLEEAVIERLKGHLLTDAKLEQMAKELNPMYLSRWPNVAQIGSQGSEGPVKR